MSPAMRPLSGSLLSFLCLLADFTRPIAVKAESARGQSALDKRYYHHDVVLDPLKHSDEFFTFVTRPDLDAPKWDVTVYKEEALSDGYWFAGPYANAVQSRPDMPWNAPHIYDGNGDLIWSGAPVFSGFTTFDFRTVNVLGKPMLSVISQHRGEAVIFDDTYEIHHIVDLGENKLHEDVVGLNIHEFTTVENGTKALYLTREPHRAPPEMAHAVGVNGSCYAVFDGIRELDTETWETTWSWTSYGKIGLDESVMRPWCNHPEPWDYWHSNSIDKFPNGDYLVSGRRSYTVYRVSRETGEILWRLGGEKSDFDMKGFKLGGQHAVKIVKTDNRFVVLSIFDNAVGPSHPPTTYDHSRGLIVRLDIKKMTANIIQQFDHPENGYAHERGNMHLLDNKNVWLCWVQNALQSEHAPDGTLLMEAKFRAGVSSYRTFKSPWIGRPQYPPDVHAQVVSKAGQWYTVVHMSWNGATEHVQWRVYHTDQQGHHQKQVAKIERSGFETSAWTNGYNAHVFVEAYDKNGEMLGKSKIFASLPPRNSTQGGFEVGDSYGDAASASMLSSATVSKTTTSTQAVKHKPTKKPHKTAATAEPTYIVVAPEGSEAEETPDVHEIEESYIKSLIYDSRATLAFGIVIGMAIAWGLVCAGVFKRMWRPRRRSSLAWWKNKGESYKAVERDERDEFELGDYSEDEDEMSESKSKSSGSR